MLAEEVDGNGVLAVAAVPPGKLGRGAVPEVLLRRVVECVVLAVPPEIGEEEGEDGEESQEREPRVEGIRALPRIGGNNSDQPSRYRFSSRMRQMTDGRSKRGVSVRQIEREQQMCTITLFISSPLVPRRAAETDG